MCLWFCETFCCFLLRCRDSYIQDTSTGASNRNRDTEFGEARFPDNVHTHMELPALPPSRDRVQNVQYYQQKPHLDMPHHWMVAERSREGPLPSLQDPNITHLTSRRWQVDTHTRQSCFNGNPAVEQSACDIGLYPVCSCPRSYIVRIKYSGTVCIERLLCVHLRRYQVLTVLQDIRSDECLRSPIPLTKTNRVSSPNTFNCKVSSTAINGNTIRKRPIRVLAPKAFARATHRRLPMLPRDLPKNNPPTISQYRRPCTRHTKPFAVSAQIPRRW